VSNVIVVGSGASGVHFALTALRKGHNVLMLDVGRAKPPTVGPGLDFEELKAALPDPAEYFLGRAFDSVTLPGSEGEVYAFPPNKRYVFEGMADCQTRSTGIEPLSSFAQGGLAEAWTAGVYPFNDQELSAFPFSYAQLAPYYSEVAARIGINGAADDLKRFFPQHDHLLEPLELDHHSRLLLQSYARRRDYLNQRLRCYLGRSRIATLTRAQDEREACSYCGRCMWGCPTGALYTPSITLQQCFRYPNFQYQPNVYVTHFNFDERRRISSICATATNGEQRELPIERLVLAAGTLSSTRIFLDSIFRQSGEVVRLPGLMDNRQVLIPFINLRLLGSAYEPRSYQYHQIALGMEVDVPADPGSYVHGQITTLTTGLAHPVLQNFPVDLRTAVSMFRNVRTALGVVNVNLHDTRRPENYVTLEPTTSGRAAGLVVHYTSRSDETAYISRTTTRVRQALLRLGCVAPKGMTHVRAMGASVHYSGTLPMSIAKKAYAVSPDCASYDFENLYIADGSTFPFLPAKNLTFTLMANATRVADRAF
jgi:choline dehydrogenase-like flavoprotein